MAFNINCEIGSFPISGYDFVEPFSIVTVTPPDNGNDVTWRVEIGTSPLGPFSDVNSAFPGGPGLALSANGNAVGNSFPDLTPNTPYYIRTVLTNVNTNEETIVPQICEVRTGDLISCNGSQSVTPESAVLLYSRNALASNNPLAQATIGLDTVDYEFGLVSGGPYTNTLSNIDPGPADASGQFSHNVTGLAPATTYFGRYVVRDENGAVILTGPECSFTTVAIEANCANPTIIGDTTATILGSVTGLIAGQTASLEYSTSEVGPWTVASTLAGSMGAMPMAANISGLSQSTVYFTRVVIRDGANSVIDASDPCPFVTTGQGRAFKIVKNCCIPQ